MPESINNLKKLDKNSILHDPNEGHGGGDNNARLRNFLTPIIVILVIILGCICFCCVIFKIFKKDNEKDIISEV